jgi:hypothetical protein
MYRRVLSILLLPGMVLSQSAALAHTHATGQSAGHDLRSHFHISPTHTTPQASYHGHHHHGPGGHHHHHDELDDDESATPTEIMPSHQPEPVSEHDTDAIYHSVTNLGVNTRFEVYEVVTVSCLWSLTDENSFSNDSSDLICKAFWGHPPPSDLQNPLYILHLTLLI